MWGTYVELYANTMNPLFGYSPVSDGEWVTEENPLSSFYPFRSSHHTESQQEEDDTWIENPLFDGPDKTVLLASGWLDYERIELFVEMRSNLPFSSSTDDSDVEGYNRWKVSDVVDYLEMRANKHFTRLDARVFLQQMISQEFSQRLRPLLIPVSYRVDMYETLPEDDAYLRCFTDDIRQYHIHEEVLNVKLSTSSDFDSPLSPATNATSGSFALFSEIIAKALSQRFQQQQQQQLQSQQTASGLNEFNRQLVELCKKMRPVSVRDIVRGVENIMTKILTCDNYVIYYEGSYINKLQGYVDYEAIFLSPEFQQLVKVSESLRLLDVSALEAKDATAFYCNVYNMMSLHALIVRECSDDQFPEKHFYYIGRYKLSLNDIYHRILRGADLGSKYYLGGYRSCLRQIQFDPRIHFVLHSGCVSSPMPFVMTNDAVELVLDRAARGFINTHVQIIESEKKVVLPVVFQEYRRDFCKNNMVDELTNDYLMKYLTPSKQNSLLRVIAKSGGKLSKTTVDYGEYVRTSNRKPSVAIVSSLNIDYNFVKEKIQLQFIIEDSYFNAYFKTFCAFEASVENLKFAESVFSYRRCEKGEMRAELARQIIQRYFGARLTSSVMKSSEATSPSSQQDEEIRKQLNCDLNLPQNNIVRVIQRYYSEMRRNSIPSNDLFDKLNLEVCMNLSDTYCRFINTNMFSSMLENYIRLQMEKYFKSGKAALDELLALQQQYKHFTF